MVYLIIGNDQAGIDYQLLTLLEQFDCSKITYYSYKNNLDEIDDVILQSSLFANDSCYVIKDANFIIDNSKKAIEVFKQ